MIVKALQIELQRGGPAGEAIGALLQTLRDHHPYSAEHSVRTAHMAQEIATTMGLPRGKIVAIRNAALVHDVGKIGIPRGVLLKGPGLDIEEAALIRLHPVLGASMLGTIPDLRAYAPITLHHHERYDGRGYPNGLVGEAIPLAARVIFVADAFDAMTSERNYRPRVSEQVALAEIMMCSGFQFDPAVVKALHDIRPSRAAV